MLPRATMRRRSTGRPMIRGGWVTSETVAKEGMELHNAPVERVLDDLFLVRDTCNVYVLRSGRTGLAIDFGSGRVLEHLDEMGIDRLTDVLVTHHHRDQVAGV